MDDDDYDYETPVEETPGYIGYVFDREFTAGEGLAPLQDFDWSKYTLMAVELDKTARNLVIQVGVNKLEINTDASSIEGLVGALPSVVAVFDCPPSQGPAGGS